MTATVTDHQYASNTGIAIVAPSGYAPDESAIERAVARLQAQGCQVRNYYDPLKKYQRFGAEDAIRAAQIHDAARDPNVQIIMALRGGYGMTRLLPFLDFPMLAASGKLFVGHSDFTAFQMSLLAHTGKISFAGPMICSDFSREEGSAFTYDHFWRCLLHPACELLLPESMYSELDMSGMLWGGNLAMLTHLIGTPYFPQIEGGILFVEDVNEHPYRIERMMMQLFHSGILRRQKAVLMGDFSSYRLSDYDNGYDFTAMLSYLRSQLSIPILTGLPFGHIRDKVTLPVGCKAGLVSQGAAVLLKLYDYPTLK